MPSIKSRITFQDLHYTRPFRERFISSLSEPIASMTICSPYFDLLPSPFRDVVAFCTFLAKRGTERIQIITRPPGDDRQAMSLEMAKQLAGNGVDILIKSSPYLHAKMYFIEYERGFFRCFVGSANFTRGGFERNHELVAEMEGVGIETVCHRELARMQAGGGVISYGAWIGRGLPLSKKEIV